MSENQNAKDSLNQGNSFQKGLSSSESQKNIGAQSALNSRKAAGPQPPLIVNGSGQELKQRVDPLVSPLPENSTSANFEPQNIKGRSAPLNQNKERLNSSTMGGRQTNKNNVGLWPMNLFQGWGSNFVGAMGSSGVGSSGPLGQDSKGLNTSFSSDNLKLGGNGASKANFSRGAKPGVNKSDSSSGSPLPKQPNLNKNKNKVVSVTYEEIGLFPRSFSRVFDRFFKQIFSDVENLVIQEYRFYRYLFLTTIKTLCILFIVPFAVNFIAKTYLIRPITEYFWNTQQTEIFLNSYEQKRAFSELQEFEEKLYFESLLVSKNAIVSSPFLKATTYDFVAAGSSQDRSLGNEANTELRQTEKSTLGPLGQQAVFSSITASRSNTQVNLPEGVKTAKNISNTDLNINNMAAGTLDLTRSENSLQENTQKFKGATNSTNLTTKQPDTLYSTNTPNLPETLSSLQDKILELAIRYNNHSIEAITNFFADFLSLITLLYLLVSLEIQINITKSFLLEVFFGLDDSKKSLLILIMTDLLVGYHSSNLWELFFQFIFNHYGIPESQTGIFLLVATLPVLLDVLFKYLIFRHLNRSSPATVATYHAILE